MSNPSCCPVARGLGRATLVALLAVSTFVAGRVLLADDKEKDQSASAKSDRADDGKPPQGAVVLFDGKDLSRWQRYGKEGGEAKFKLVDGAMEVAGGDIGTKDKFTGDYKLHVEFMPPNMPNASGQGKANSGIYLADNYEIQVLDSYGLEKVGLGDCAAIYSKKAPDKNAAKPPAQWQTYDIDYKAPKFDETGKKTANARITIVWNGETVHDNFEVDGPCPGGIGESPKGGQIRLQDHGNPVRFRNIWLLPTGAK